MSKIFISYRREDSAAISGRIYDRISRHFGLSNVFKDVDNIPPGVDYRVHLENAVNQCAVELVIIGKQWVEIKKNEGGNRRIALPSDFVRIEIETALKRQILILPILVEGASMPTKHELPQSLADLSFRQALVVRHDPDFHHDMDKVIEAIENFFTQPTMPVIAIQEKPRQSTSPSYQPTIPNPKEQGYSPFSPEPARSSFGSFISKENLASPTTSTQPLPQRSPSPLIPRSPVPSPIHIPSSIQYAPPQQVKIVRNDTQAFRLIISGVVAGEILTIAWFAISFVSLIVATILFALSVPLIVATWIYALVAAAQRKEWGWFILVLATSIISTVVLFPNLCTFVYSLVSLRTTKQNKQTFENDSSAQALKVPLT